MRVLDIGRRPKPYSDRARLNAAAFVIMALALLILVPACTIAPENAKSFKTVFDYYRNKENIVAISFPPGLVGMFLSDENPEQAEIKKLMQDLSAFRMLMLETGSNPGGGSTSDGGSDSDGGPAGEGESAGNSDSGSGGLAAELSEAVISFTSRNEFQDLFRIQTGEKDIFIRIQENDGIVREAIVMMHTDDSFFVIELRGNISLDHFTRLVEGGQLQNLTDLTNIDF
ncbi:MAG TPA: DUF4252 domain-containing protein [Bacteroides sp.]|nr:DUF4252 domain-containing protein [Bacteroides sp.]